MKMKKVWYCIIFYYPQGLPKLNYLTCLPDVKQWARQSLRKRNLTKILFAFKLVDKRGNLLKYGEHLASMFRPFDIAGYRDARLILRADSDPRLTYRKEISAKTWFCNTVVFSDGSKEIIATHNIWEKALCNFLLSLPEEKE